MNEQERGNKGVDLWSSIFSSEMGRVSARMNRRGIWWLIPWPLISHRSYIGFWYWRWVFVARIYSHCKRYPSTHIFREFFTLHPYKKVKLLFLFFPPGTWIPVICATLSVQCQSLLPRPALSHHLPSCPSLALWRRVSVNQEILSATKPCRTKTLYGQHGCTQLIFQASRHLDLFSRAA